MEPSYWTVSESSTDRAETFPSLPSHHRCSRRRPESSEMRSREGIAPRGRWHLSHSEVQPVVRARSSDRIGPEGLSVHGHTVDDLVRHGGSGEVESDLEGDPAVAVPVAGPPSRLVGARRIGFRSPGDGEGLRSGSDQRTCLGRVRAAVVYVVQIESDRMIPGRPRGTGERYAEATDQSLITSVTCVR